MASVRWVVWAGTGMGCLLVGGWGRPSAPTPGWVACSGAVAGEDRRWAGFGLLGYGGVRGGFLVRCGCGCGCGLYRLGLVGLVGWRGEVAGFAGGADELQGAQRHPVGVGGVAGSGAQVSGGVPDGAPARVGVGAGGDAARDVAGVAVPLVATPGRGVAARWRCGAVGGCGGAAAGSGVAACGSAASRCVGAGAVLVVGSKRWASILAAASRAIADQPEMARAMGLFGATATLAAMLARVPTVSTIQGSRPLGRPRRRSASSTSAPMRSRPSTQIGKAWASRPKTSWRLREQHHVLVGDGAGQAGQPGNGEHRDDAGGDVGGGVQARRAHRLPPQSVGGGRTAALARVGEGSAGAHGGQRGRGGWFGNAGRCSRRRWPPSRTAWFPSWLVSRPRVVGGAGAGETTRGWSAGGAGHRGVVSPRRWLVVRVAVVSWPAVR